MVIGARTAAWQRSSGLPSSYQQVEWVGNTSSGPIIGTGIYPTAHTTFEFDGQIVNDQVIWGCNMGTIGGEWNRYQFGRRSNQQDGFFYGFFFGTKGSHAGTGTSNPAARHLFSFDGERFLVDDNIFSVGIGAYFYTAINDFRILGQESGTFNSGSRFYSGKMWESGVLVRDFVPCYKKADGSAGLYDFVNAEFHGNEASGTLVVGPDV